MIDLSGTKKFFIASGLLLVISALLGFLVLGPTEQKSFFGPLWYFDNQENILHLVWGLIALTAVFLPKTFQKSAALLIAIFGIALGLYSAIGTVPNGEFLWGMNLENPLDSLLHALIGVWALFAAVQ